MPKPKPARPPRAKYSPLDDKSLSDIVKIALPLAREVLLEIAVDGLDEYGDGRFDLADVVVQLLGRKEQDFLSADDPLISRQLLALRAACAFGLAVGLHLAPELFQRVLNPVTTPRVSRL